MGVFAFVGIAGLVVGCSAPAADAPVIAAEATAAVDADLFSFPAEWEPHDTVWVGWVPPREGRPERHETMNAMTVDIIGALRDHVRIEVIVQNEAAAAEAGIPAAFYQLKWRANKEPPALGTGGSLLHGGGSRRGAGAGIMSGGLLEVVVEAGAHLLGVDPQVRADLLEPFAFDEIVGRALLNPPQLLELVLLELVASLEALQVLQIHHGALDDRAPEIDTGVDILVRLCMLGDLRFKMRRHAVSDSSYVHG